MNFGEGVPFERIRRITGYIVGDYKSRFNNAKRKECEERVKHENSNYSNSKLSFDRNNNENNGEIDE